MFLAGEHDKTRMEWKTKSQTEWLNFIEKLYFTIVGLFCRYKSDNNKHFAYINHLPLCPQRLIGKKDTMPCT